MVHFPLDQDPEANWESQRYDQPIPSRRYILKALEAIAKPVSHEQLAEAFGVAIDPPPEDNEAVDRDTPFAAMGYRLKAMIRDAQVIRNRQGDFCLVSKTDLVQGRILGHADGFGFFRPDNGDPDLYLSFRQMRMVFDGDKVLVRLAGKDRRGRDQAQIVEVIEHANSLLVGRYYEESGVAFVVPDNRRISHQILISPDAIADAKHGDCVELVITLPPTYKHQPYGKIIKRLGNEATPGIETEMALRTYSIPHEWPDEVTQEISGLTDTVAEAEKKHRVDLRELPLVTIDGSDARDFDDAVYCEMKKTGGFRLLVAIADVSSYVQKGSALDVEAKERGTSVYFPNRVVPMLPEVLSNGLCSLNPLVDRLCLVCEINISKIGRVLSYKFMEGLMSSHARLTYQEAQAYLDTDQFEWQDHLPENLKPEGVRQNLRNLYQLYRLQLGIRQKRGAIEFSTQETQICYNDNGRIDKIIGRERLDTHRLIEECMLLANVAAGNALNNHELPALYRVHEQPDPAKLEKLNNFLATLGIQLPKRKKTQPKDFQAILELIKDRPDAHLIQVILLRSMMQAQYREEPLGHFGLAYPVYAHFTSPIRRYPDLLVHRALRYLIRSKLESKHVIRVPGAKVLAKKHWLMTSKPQLADLGAQCSSNERRADEASRDATDWLKCEYMSEKIGQQYVGVISSVTSFGIFIQLTDIFVEGLVHISALARDYYRYDDIRHQLVGQNSGITHMLGDSVSVTVNSVDMEARKIDFELLENQSASLRPAVRSEATEKTSDSKRKSRQKKQRKRSSRHKKSDVSSSQVVSDEAVGKKKTDKKKTTAKNSVNKKAASKKTVSKKSGSKKSGSKGSVSKKTGSKEVVSKETSSKEVTSKKSGNKTATRKKATSKKASGQKAEKKVAVSKEVAGKASTSKKKTVGKSSGKKTAHKKEVSNSVGIEKGTRSSKKKTGSSGEKKLGQTRRHKKNSET